MKNNINVGIIGASGYSGEELLRLLNHHPHASIRLITSRQYAGKKIEEIFPKFWGTDFKFVMPVIDELLSADIDVYFLALPHKVASEFAMPFIKAGKRVIDISADFRLKDKNIYKEYYGNNHPCPELLKDSVYGLAEVYREDIQNAFLIACPGCYPTSILLPLYPLIKENLIKFDDIIVCSGSGVTGAGRKVDLSYIFPECNESFRTYSPVKHRHIPEIEQQLNKFADLDNAIKINFIPHLVPMNRGMNSTLILKVSDKFVKETINDCYKSYYANEQFIRILSYGTVADTKNTGFSNVCEIGFVYDERTKKLIVTSSIDNLTKGAAGQAVQCMNIMFGIEESFGLL